MDYFNGKTSYSVSQQHLSAHDIPTLAICLKTSVYNDWLDKNWGKYGDYFYTNITYYGSTRRATATLKMNKTVMNPQGFHTHLSELQQSLKIEKELKESFNITQLKKLSLKRSSKDLFPV